jgi:hypothetical protein
VSETRAVAQKQKDEPVDRVGTVVPNARELPQENPVRTLRPMYSSNSWGIQSRHTDRPVLWPSRN